MFIVLRYLLTCLFLGLKFYQYKRDWHIWERRFFYDSHMISEYDQILVIQETIEGFYKSKKRRTWDLHKIYVSFLKFLHDVLESDPQLLHEFPKGAMWLSL